MSPHIPRAVFGHVGCYGNGDKQDLSMSLLPCTHFSDTDSTMGGAHATCNSTPRTAGRSSAYRDAVKRFIIHNSRVSGGAPARFPNVAGDYRT